MKNKKDGYRISFDSDKDFLLEEKATTSGGGLSLGSTVESRDISPRKTTI